MAALSAPATFPGAIMHTLAAPIHALPLDIMRVVAGGVLFVYFANALRQARDFSDPDGLIDHRLSARLFPPTRISLFQPGMPGWVFRTVYLCACVAAVLVILGWHPRTAAAFLFVAAVSTYRWNALVAYLDDCIVHLFCLWLILLPVGSTLSLPDLVGAGAAVAGPTASAWATETVPGTAPRAFMINMALIYLVAGLYKFSSPMWRGGSAMHAALKMQIARTPDFWSIRHRRILRLVTWAALVLEPLFVLIFVLPAGSAAKWALLAAAAVFHLGIIATLKIPYSNALMLAALALPFAPEIMQGISPDITALAAGSASGLAAPALATTAPAASPGPADITALTLVALLAIMSVWQAVRAWRHLPKPGQPYSGKAWANPVRALLWLAGLFQSYRLFDWVDERNYHARYEVRSLRAGRERSIEPRKLFPESMRHLLLQSYFLGNVWLQMEPEKLAAVRGSLLERHARRFARAHPDAGDIEAVAFVQRITPDNLELTRGERLPLMRFTCADGQAVVHLPDGPPPESALRRGPD
ncbi:MAG: hypothetical protein F4Z31_16615 [Gemmatimonadetes bacterium]|nr:hypothetical protein [Gemmatimonadota bacterium]MYE91776.1 hypothetical protein [Gemmatimonadota bacterium]MYJ11596.1 hypothetical protein [Gemmatimonadota bacterium]